MIAYLNGKIVEKTDSSIVIDTNGVGYEVHCSPHSLSRLPDVGGTCQLFIHTQYRADGGASLFGFTSNPEKALFLELIKVDSVGPKSALNITAAAPWDELVQLIEDGDIGALSKLPKISKKTAEHVVVKLKGKLGELLIRGAGGILTPSQGRVSKSSEVRKMRSEASTALAHLGFRLQDVERALDELKEDVWGGGDLQSVIRQALNDLSGNV